MFPDLKPPHFHSRTYYHTNIQGLKRQNARKQEHVGILLLIITPWRSTEKTSPKHVHLPWDSGGDTWNRGQRQSLISRLLSTNVSAKVATPRKEILVCGIHLGAKKWKDGNRGKGGDRKPENVSSLCPSERKQWSSETYFSTCVCMHEEGAKLQGQLKEMRIQTEN